MNNATFAGRLGRDAETRTTQGGTAATSFSLAVDEYAGQGERRTLWVDCTIWGERGQKLSQYLTKGAPVAVSGQAGIRTFESRQTGETKATLTLNVREITLLGSRADGEQQQRLAPASKPQQAAQQRPAPAPAQDFADDDIPF